MLSYANFYEQIPIEVALLAQLYGIAVSDTFRNDDFLFDVFVLNSAAPATGAELFDFGAFTITRVACSLHDKRSLTHSLCSCPIA